MIRLLQTLLLASVSFVLFGCAASQSDTTSTNTPTFRPAATPPNPSLRTPRPTAQLTATKLPISTLGPAITIVTPRATITTSQNSPTPERTLTATATPEPMPTQEPAPSPTYTFDPGTFTAVVSPQPTNNDNAEAKEISYEFGGTGLATTEPFEVPEGYFCVFVRGKPNIYFKASAIWHSREIAAPTLHSKGFLNNYFPANNGWVGKCHMVKNWSGFLSAGATFIPAGMYSVEVWTYDDVTWESKICTSRTELERNCP